MGINCQFWYIPLIFDYIGIQLSYNSGIAFSLPITGIPLKLLTLLLIGFLVYHYVREEYDKKSKLLDF
jgi:lipoprotein signal peptidase